VTVANTITRDKGKLLVVKKDVVGGNATKHDWTMTATNDVVTPAKNYTGKGDATEFQQIWAGEPYTLHEEGPDNYTGGDWSCEAVGDTQQPTLDGNVVTVPKNGQVKCEITNTRDTAKLKLVKVVEGKGDPNDWELTATGPDGAPNVKNLGGEGKSETVWSGVEYKLAETGPGKYTPSAWSCLANENTDQVSADKVEGELNEGDSITLEKNADVVCTITNSRNTAQLKLVKKVSSGKAQADEFTLSAKAEAPDNDLNFSNKGGSGDFQQVFAETEYTLAESGPAGYTGGQWVCESSEVTPEFVQNGDKITLDKGDKVTCTIVNTRDTGSLTISKEFNAQTSGYTGTFDINYACVDGADPVKSGTVKLADGKSETITGLPTGTVCTVTEPTLPTIDGWKFNTPTFTPASGQVTVTAKDQSVSVAVVNSITKVNPVVVKRVCPIEPTVVKTIKVKKNGQRVLVKKIKTNKSNCVLLKPVVLCQPVNSAAAGETAFCDTKVTKKGRITVKVKGYDKVRVKVIVRAKPKPGHEDLWKPNTRRKSWVLRS